jgi:O-acetyl-ADP-ribose deacetylase
MPFKIVRDDITHISADVIVNSANPHAVIGGGVDAAIHMAAGPRLIEARKKIGDIAEGDVRYSRAFDLLARYVFHAVGPDCRKPQPNMEEKLRNCYAKSLKMAKDLSCESIAFPMISTGIYDCPKDQAFQIAISTISDFLMTNDMEVTLVVYDSEAYGLSTKLFHDVKAYVDEHYVESIPRDAGISGLDEEDARAREFITNDRRMQESQPKTRFFGELDQKSIGELDQKSIEAPTEDIRWSIDTEKQIPILDDHGLIKKIKPNGETFSQMLLRLIDLSGKKDSEIYLKAGQTRQLFSKIRNQKNYQPSKNTVLSFALALELNMDQTMDLLKSAGYTLSDGIVMDLAFRYFFENQIYNIFDIKITLFHMGIEF